MKPLKLFLLLSLLPVAGWTAPLGVVRQSLPVADVTLLPGSSFHHAQQMDIRYLLGLDPDRLAAPYLKAAGLEAKAPNYTNWENTGLDGHIGGHYLSALAYMYAATGNEEIAVRLDYMLGELKRAQDASPSGYLCGDPHGERLWLDIQRGDIRAQTFGLNGGWVPLYNIHKTYAGLRDAYLVGGRKEARAMLVKLTDWMIGITAGLTDQQMQDMLRSEHGGLNEVFADVYAITGDSRYLDLARRFSHQVILDPLLRHEDRLTGIHANTQIPKVIGFKRIADLAGDAAWDDAAAFFWQTVVGHRSITIGGNSVREHFHSDKDFQPMLQSEQGPETCNTYNMLRLSKLLWQTSGDVRYMDYYERALLNHILSSQDPVQGGLVYFTPMRSGHYRVYSQPQTSMWCCVGSGMENHARYGEMIYSSAADTALFVNLFIPSSVRWKGWQVVQQNRFPDEEGTSIVFHQPAKGGKKVAKGKADAATALYVRIPEWTDAAGVTLSLNGSPLTVDVQGGYARVERRWVEGDSLYVSLPMHLRAIGLPDGSPNYSFLYGPVVLASDMGRQDQEGLFADDSRGGHIAAGRRIPLSDIPVIVSPSRANIINNIKKVDPNALVFELSGSGQPQRLVPFYRLHECRYMVYWNVVTPDQQEARLAELARQEQARQALDMRTLDKVVCGEQQPESDHFVQMNRTQAGSDDDLHYRVALQGGFFAYKMRNVTARKAARLLVSCRVAPKADAVLLADGKEVGQIAPSSGQGQQVLEFDLPAALHDQPEVLLQIQPAQQKATPHIYEIRLLSAE